MQQQSNRAAQAVASRPPFAGVAQRQATDAAKAPYDDDFLRVDTFIDQDGRRFVFPETD